MWVFFLPTCGLHPPRFLAVGISSSSQAFVPSSVGIFSPDLRPAPSSVSGCGHFRLKSGFCTLLCGYFHSDLRPAPSSISSWGCFRLKSGFCTLLCGYFRSDLLPVPFSTSSCGHFRLKFRLLYPLMRVLSALTRALYPPPLPAVGISSLSQAFVPSYVGIFALTCCLYPSLLLAVGISSSSQAFVPSYVGIFALTCDLYPSLLLAVGISSSGQAFVPSSVGIFGSTLRPAPFSISDCGCFRLKPGIYTLSRPDYGLKLSFSTTS